MLLIDPITCLAAALYFESRGELKINQLRVAQTIVNRVESRRYPSTICKVVKQRNQFTFFWDGKEEKVLDEEAWIDSIYLATKVIKEDLEVADMGNVCHYARNDISNYWTASMIKKVHGNHAFYKGGC